MEMSTKQMLILLAAAMGTKEDIGDMQEADWNKLFNLARSHNILPVLYEPIQKTEGYLALEPELSDAWRKLSIKISINQMYRTMEFLKIYENLNNANVLALVVKGIICRELYPNHYYRSSGDEDLYIRKIDFQKVDAILLSNGLKRVKSKNWKSIREQVTTYRSPIYGLEIELHVDLFDPDTDLFGLMNTFFINSFEESITVKVEGITIHTLSHDMHLLFLILHSIKHFLVIGFGIRQVCDLVMYSNTYGKGVNWSWVWEQVTNLGYKVFLLNLFDIGIKYLGLNQEMICYPPIWSVTEIHSDDLLEDIIHAGIFGKNVLGRDKTRCMTLQALLNDKKNYTVQRNKPLLFAAICPGIHTLGSTYSYCIKYPFLLPVAWIHRIVAYAVMEKTPGNIIGKAANSIVIAKKRIELLKEYKIIEVREE